MPRKKIEPEAPPVSPGGELVQRLADELKSSREGGQPLIYEQEFRTGKVRVTVIWDEWGRTSLDERSSTILRAYEKAEGADFRDRIALASGLTVPEAYEAGMLSYQVLPALRKDDRVTRQQVRQAMLDEGASVLANSEVPQLRFATEEEAEACRQRLIRRLPDSEPVWMIHRELRARDFARAQDSAYMSE